MKPTVPALCLLIATAGSPFGQVAQKADVPQRKIDCYCTDSVGARVELGIEICLVVGGRAFIARCEMSLNNPMWREVAEGCPAASLVRNDSGRILLK